VLEDVNRVTDRIIGATIEVRPALGPGLLQSADEQCLVWELEGAGVGVDRQVLLPIGYKGKAVPDAFRVGLLVQSLVVVELKTLDEVVPVHLAQLLT
jgi:GxxExxY protein